ncbi:MAG: PHP domain-containing protein [Candidatus Marinimicrobia bacterium]|nr:PHP domain-containing protein [Candidatus Neomarinimicrobiota bacterium]
MSWRLDCHIHSCLSPCGELTGSPRALAEAARAADLDALALTDHNSGANLPALAAAAAEAGLWFLPGIEITTVEEAHLLAYFPTLERAARFAADLYGNAPPQPYDPERQGDQPEVNLAGEILRFEPRYLGQAVPRGVDELVADLHALGALAVPAHVDRPHFSLPAQLGFLPDLPFDAVEVSWRTPDPQVPRWAGKYPVLCGSDAHAPEQVGRAWTELPGPDGPSWQALVRALRQGATRRVSRNLNLDSADPNLT